MDSFTHSALELFAHQACTCPIYARYLDLLEVRPQHVHSLEQIPFLPIRFFKQEKIYCASAPPECVFTSSATTGMTPSRHYIDSLNHYRANILAGFNEFYGSPGQYAFLALLPSYLEREGSSLVYMARALMEESGHPSNGFYLYNHEELFRKLQENAASGQKTWLIGVSFALLDFVARYQVDAPLTTVVETGGMKGRGQELSREELHLRLREGFPSSAIHSEYGMAELLSQAYSNQEDGYFSCSSTLKVIIRDLQDPFTHLGNGHIGGINLIDLANTHSCAFIETEDLGVCRDDGRFQVLGRIPHTQMRGCNMLIDID